MATAQELATAVQDAVDQLKTALIDQSTAQSAVDAATATKAQTAAADAAAQVALDNAKANLAAREQVVKAAMVQLDQATNALDPSLAKPST